MSAKANCVAESTSLSVLHIICGCGVKFQDEGSLRAHLRTQHPRGRHNKEYKCGECGSIFATEEECVRHFEEAHTEEEEGSEGTLDIADTTAETSEIIETETPGNSQHTISVRGRDLFPARVTASAADTGVEAYTDHQYEAAHTDCEDVKYEDPETQYTVEYLAEGSDGEEYVGSLVSIPADAEEEVQCEEAHAQDTIYHGADVKVEYEYQEYEEYTEDVQDESSQAEPDSDQHYEASAEPQFEVAAADDDGLQEKPAPKLKMVRDAETNSLVLKFERAAPKGPARPKKGRPRICEQCGKTYTSLAALRYHQRVHSGERPYCCDVCPKTFTMPLFLEIHKRTHSGTRPFKCADCDKAFTNKAALMRHDRVHTGEKPYSCPMCQKCFTQSNSLKLHVATVHLKQPAPYKSRKNRALQEARPHKPATKRTGLSEANILAFASQPNKRRHHTSSDDDYHVGSEETVSQD